MFPEKTIFLCCIAFNLHLEEVVVTSETFFVRFVYIRKYIKRYVGLSFSRSHPAMLMLLVI